MIRVNKTSIVFMLFLALLLFFSFALAQETPLERIKEKILERKQENQPKNSQQLTIPCGGQPVCGNDICEPGENRLNCKQDCGINPPPYHQEKYERLEFYDSLMKKKMIRTYMVHVPARYSRGTPMPLILNFHGALGTGESAEISIGGMNKKSDEEGFIAVYPNGVSKIGFPGRKQYWNAGSLYDVGALPVDDLGFISALLDALEFKYTIDTKRIYATGLSNGAWMAHTVACKLSERIAAIAPVGGGLPLSDCQPEEPVSIILFHGTADPGWPYNGGGGCWTNTIRRPIKETVSTWAAWDSCASAASVTFQKGQVSCVTYSPCAKGTEITFCTIEGGGHTFPGGYTFPAERIIPWDDDCALGHKGRGVGEVNKDISALDMMWDFFKKHPKQ